MKQKSKYQITHQAWSMMLVWNISHTAQTLKWNAVKGFLFEKAVSQIISRRNHVCFFGFSWKRVASVWSVSCSETHHSYDNDVTQNTTATWSY